MNLVSVLLLLLTTSWTQTNALEQSPLRGRNLLKTLPWIGPDFDVGVDGVDMFFPAIDTSGVHAVKISVDLSNRKTLEGAEAEEKDRDAVQAFYQIDSGPKVLWLDADGENHSPEYEILVPAGAKLTLSVKGKTSYIREAYEFRNLQVTAVDAPVPPESNPVQNQPTPVAAPIPTVGCDSVMSGKNVDIGVDGVEEFLTFDTSCLGLVEVEFELSHKGILEKMGPSIDFLKVFYKVDNGAYQPWVDVVGETYEENLRSPKVVVDSGKKLTLRFIGETSSDSEVYMVRNLLVFEAGPPDAPAPAPVFAPVDPAPPSPQVCGVPEFEGKWVEPHGDFPITVIEGHGALIGDDFCMVSGFFDGIDQSTPKIFCIDTQDTRADWIERVNLKDRDSIEGTKLSEGLSHGAEAVVGSRFYMCGGFLGGNPGEAIKDCWYYDHAANSIMPITSLPEPRGGGSMIYSPAYNMLIFTAGAVRPVRGKGYSIDYYDTWTYNLSKGDNGAWVSQDDIPYSGNHIMYSRGYDQFGGEHYYVMGGQIGEDERYGNQKLMYEFVPNKPSGKQWVRRADLLVKRGHANESTRPYGCGIIMISGTTDRPKGKIDSIHYYDIPSNTWMDIGSFDDEENTPVCDFYTDRSGQDFVWCTSPRGIYKKRKISIPSA